MHFEWVFWVPLSWLAWEEQTLTRVVWQQDKGCVVQTGAASEWAAVAAQTPGVWSRAAFPGGTVPALTLWMSFSMRSALGWCRCRRTSSSESSWSILVDTMTRALRVHWSNHFSKCSKKPARSLTERPGRVIVTTIGTWERSSHIDKVPGPFAPSSLFYFPKALCFWSGWTIILLLYPCWRALDSFQPFVLTEKATMTKLVHMLSVKAFL